jgi:membrane protein DedA with SNARE-associated domain
VSGELLALLTSYGSPALFLILLVTSAGAPFPDSLLLIAVGSFVARGDLDFVPVVVVGTLGAVARDQIGYALGYWGGRPLAARVAGADRIAKAEAFSRKWGRSRYFLQSVADRATGSVDQHHQRDDRLSLAAFRVA